MAKETSRTQHECSPTKKKLINKLFERSGKFGANSPEVLQRAVKWFLAFSLKSGNLRWENVILEEDRINGHKYWFSFPKQDLTHA